MRQRNDGDTPLNVHTDPPQVIEPGDVIEHDTPVVGLTVLDEPAAEPESTEPLPASLATAKKTKEATR